MTPAYERDGIRLYVGDCREVVPALPDPVSAIVTDPPYGLTQRANTTYMSAFPGRYDHHKPRGGFMGMKWDGTAIERDPMFWEVVRDAMLPGAHLLSFGGTRTQHRIAVAIEDAGFEIRDTLMWLYGSGFPKSHNLDGEWQGWGTALKPAYEPIIMARKPLAGTVAQNVLTHSTGALNIDGCRLPLADTPRYGKRGNGAVGSGGVYEGGYNPENYSGPDHPHPESARHDARGRWPANVILDEHAAAMLDQMSGERKTGVAYKHASGTNDIYGAINARQTTEKAANGGDTGGASRFFYCAKASRAERNAGLDGMPTKMLRWSAGDQNPGSFQSEGTNRHAQNHHPTVKPLALMRWLLTLVTPPGGIVVDPFTGSGSTLVACAQLGIAAYGIDMNEEYIEIAARRIDHALNERAREEAKPRQLSIAD